MNSVARYRTLVTTLLFSLLWTTSLTLNATEQKPAADVRVLVDMSGSMKKNDPDNLRIPAIQMMSNLLPGDAQAGVWTFGQYVNMLVPLAPVDAQWKANATEAAKKINSLGLFTNIGGAMEKASFGWNTPDPDIKRSLILLTDGVVDVSKDPAENAAARRTVLRELLPKYKAAGITIHTIALSGDADERLLAQMASETDGWYQKVANAGELQKVFLKIFEQATERDTVPLEDNRFKVDDAIEEFTLLVFKTENAKPTVLEQPDGEQFNAGTVNPNLNWFESVDYDLITISNPMAGEWRVYAEVDPDNRVMVVSNLSMKSSPIPNNLLANETFEFSINLEQEEQVISEADFLSLVDFSLSIEGEGSEPLMFRPLDEGANADKTPGDGIYTVIANAPSVAGIANINAIAKSPTFERMRQQAINVFSSPVEVTQELSTDVSVPHKVSFTPITEVALADSIELTVNVTMPDGSAEAMVAERDKGYTLAVNLPVVERGGEYTLQLSVKGETPAGRRFEVAPPLIRLTTESLLPDEPVVEVEPEPVVEQPEVQTEEQVDESEALVDEPEEEGMSLMMMALIGLGINLILGVIGFIIFKQLKKRNAAQAEAFGEELENP